LRTGVIRPFVLVILGVCEPYPGAFPTTQNLGKIRISGKDLVHLRVGVSLKPIKSPSNTIFLTIHLSEEKNICTRCRLSSEVREIKPAPQTEEDPGQIHIFGWRLRPSLPFDQRALTVDTRVESRHNTMCDTEENFEKLKKNDSTFYKLELEFKAATYASTDWEGLKIALKENTVVREVHIRIEKAFVDTCNIQEILPVFEAVGSLSNLKYLCLGQMMGQVQVFGHMPIQAITATLKTAGDRLLWLYMRGLILTHVYGGSEEEMEDKTEVFATERKEEAPSDKKDKKKKDSKKSSSKDDKKSSKDDKKKKDSKKSSKKASSEEKAAWSRELEDGPKLAAKRAFKKMGKALSGLKNLKKVSFMVHVNEEMYACRLDPLLEGLAPCQNLELVICAITRHDGRILSDPSSMGKFFDGCPKLKEASIIYTELTDDHIDEVASGVAKHETLEELNLAGHGSASPESIGALFRAPKLKKLVLKEMMMDDQCVVAASIALAHFTNLEHVEFECNLKSPQIMTLSQMIIVNSGIQTLHLYLASLDSTSSPLDLGAAVLANKQSKLKKIIFEARSAEVKKIDEIDLADWVGVLEGVFKADSSHTIDSRSITLERI
jgi:hypothetical protein